VSSRMLALTHPNGGDPTVVPAAARAVMTGGVYPAADGAFGGFAGRPARLEDCLTSSRKTDDITNTQVDGEDPGA